ncbi:MAG: response regulator [Rhodospirillales bacterium]|nr:response regulator [Rhodospirillales bacterium]
MSSETSRYNWWSGAQRWHGSGQPVAYKLGFHPWARVVLADGNRGMRRSVRGLLAELGVGDVIEVSDGAEAWERLRQVTPDLIVTELAMAPLNGLDLVRLVRGTPGSMVRYVPILMVSAYTQTSMVERARDAGIDAFIAKPFPRGLFLARVARLLEARRIMVHLRHPPQANDELGIA